MAHIVLTTLGSYGDLHPILSLGLALKKNQHQVTIATSEYYRENVKQVGLNFHPIRPDLTDDPHMAQQLMDPVKGPQYLMQALLMPALPHMLEDLRPVVEHCDALLTTTLVFPAPLLARLFNKPWASVVFQPMTLMSAIDPPYFPNIPYWGNSLIQQAPMGFQIMRQLGELWTNTWFQKFHQLRHQLGISDYGNPAFQGQFSPYLNLAMFPSVMGSPQEDWPEYTQQTGYVSHPELDLSDEQMTPDLKQFLDGGDSPVVVTLGTAASRAPGKVYHELLQGLEQANERAVVLVGKQHFHRYTAPSDNIFIAPYAPFHQLFPKAKLIIHSCGMGTLTKALKSGKPQLMVPFAFDQPDNARRLKKLGVGEVIPNYQLNARRLHQVLRQYKTSCSYENNARKIKSKITSAEEATQKAVQYIESELLKPLPQSHT